MTNREFTSFLKKAEKVIFWNNGYKVTLGYAYKYGIDNPSYFTDTTDECRRILKEIENEIYYRFSNNIPLTAVQQEILNR